MFYSTFLPLIGVLMMLCAGYIGGFYEYAAKNEVAQRHPFTAEKKIRLYGKMLQYTLIAGSIYVLVNTVDVILAGLVYLYAEFGLPRVMRSKYEKIFDNQKKQQ